MSEKPQAPPMSGKVGDDMVERAARALYEHATGGFVGFDNIITTPWWNAARIALEAALSDSPQDGWMLVPREPTEYMLLKAETAYAVPWVRPMANAYKALIESAPPQDGGGK